MLLALALAAAIALYAPTLGRGLVNYDDPWLVRDNWLLREHSWASLHAVLFDTSRDTRFVLGAEYLPVRDVSIMLDGALWGDWYGGFHLTNLVVYLASIIAWFCALDAFGIDRRVAGLAVLLWAVHPSHAESVAWITERKGVLACLFAGVTALAYARFRGGRSARWLALAIVAAVCAVWSKAPAAFAIAALAGLEVVLPAQRRSWRRSLVGLGAIGAASLAAFVPVMLVAVQAAVVGNEDRAPAGYAAMALGLHGFYLELASLAVRSAASYEIATLGPTAIEIGLGALGLVAALAVAVVPARGWFRPPPALRAAAILWLANWLPVSRLVLPLHAVLVADRYLLLATLGVALAAAVGIERIAKPRIRIALIAVLVTAAGLRALDAQESWRDSETLWARAVEANPADGDAWSMYAAALLEAHEPEASEAAIAEGLKHSSAPRLLLHEALAQLQRGEREAGIATMRRAAEAGEPTAMANLSLLVTDLTWARKATATAPMSVHVWRTLGKLALPTRPDEAREAFRRALALEPESCTNRYNLALAELAMDQPAVALPLLEACVHDVSLGDKVGAALDDAHRRLPR